LRSKKVCESLIPISVGISENHFFRSKKVCESLIPIFVGILSNKI
jgi:hypothetical protein